MEDDGPPTEGDSPSLAFLRDLAHVSDQPPGPFRLAAAVGPPALAAAAGAPVASARFEARRRLGAGGFGVVYEAFDRERNATVALKVLQRRDPRAVARFKHEFRSLCEIVHENLVQLHELHAEDEAWFLTMELVRGVDVIRFVRPAGGRFQEERLRGALAQLAEGLSFLHRSGKLHRDVKPSNVLVTGEGRVVLLDFGLVADLKAAPIADGGRLPMPPASAFEEGVLGTPAYMAPEQAVGLPVGTAADWYAVGVVLYEALTGRLPFGPGPRPASPPPRPRDLAEGVPEDLERLCLDLLDRAPERRPRGRDVRARLSPERRGGRPRGEGARREVPFIGRASHLAALREARRDAEQGCALVVLLQGRSGMGKSALIRRFLEELSARGPRRLVLSGRCFEQESVPYKAVDGIVDDLCRRLLAMPVDDRAALLPVELPALARIFPQLRPLAAPGSLPAEATHPATRRRAFAALRELLDHLDPCPVLAVDDLQWADLDSVALLAGVLRGIGERPGPILLVAAYRLEEAEASPVLRAFSAALADLGGRIAVRAVEVGELDDLDAEALSRSLLEADGRSGDALAEAAIRTIVAEARGDPFLLGELARYGARARGAETLDSLGGSGPAPGLDAVALLSARIGRLPASARSLLEVVAVAGQPVARAIAARAAYGGEAPEQELLALGRLRAGRLLRRRHAHGREELVPYHDRIREAVAAQLDPEVGRGHHERLALALEEEGGAESERLLFHYRAAGRFPEALRHAERAAAQAHEALAFDRAARLYREAIDLQVAARVPGSRRRANQARLGEALTSAGRPREAAAAHLAAAEGAAPAEALSSRCRAMEQLLAAGYVEEGRAVLHDVLREVGVAPPPSSARALLSFAVQRLRLGARGLRFHERPASRCAERSLVRVDARSAVAAALLVVDPVLAMESQAQNLREALELGEPYRVGRALAVDAIFSALLRGRAHPATDRALAMARDIGQRLDHPHLAGIERLAAGIAGMGVGQWRSAHDRLLEAESILRARCTGVWWELDQSRLQRAVCLWMLGEVRALARLSPALVDEARERGNRHLEAAMELFGGTLCALAADRPDEARRAVASALSRWACRPGSFQHFREVTARAQIALYEGDDRAARAILEDAWPAFYRGGLLFTPALGGELRVLRGVSALSAGDLRRARGLARALARSPIPVVVDGARVIQGTLLRRGGDLAGGLRLLERAEREARSRGMMLFAAAVQRRRGEWTVGSEGRALIEGADAWMTGQGVEAPARMTRMLLGAP